MATNPGGVPLPQSTAVTPKQTTENISTQSQSIPRPDTIDYLKIRVYLYKFAPEMKFAERTSSAGITQNTLAVQRKGEAKKIYEDLTKIKTILEAIGPLYPSPNSNKSLFTQARANINFLLNKPAIGSSRTLYLGRPEVSGGTSSSYVGVVGVPFEGGGFPKNGNEKEGDPLHIRSAVYETSQRSLYSACKHILIPALDALAAGNESTNYQDAEEVRLGVIEFLKTAIDKATDLSGDDSFLNNLSSTNVTYTTSLQQFKVSRFTYDLSTKDLFRFDLSSYVSNYQTNQTAGLAGSVGTINGGVAFQNSIIPSGQLGISEGLNAVRRPIFFPDSYGNYAGWFKDAPLAGRSYGTGGASSSPSVADDPITKEKVSTEGADTLIHRIAQQQTCEDNGGTDTFENDVVRIEVAIRLRGIRNPHKKELIIQFFKYGTRPQGLYDYIPASKQGNFHDITPGDILQQKYQLEKVLTDPKEDGVTIGDLVQKRDFVSVFVYNHPVSPIKIESIAQSLDSFYFDKESLFLYAPLQKFIGGPTRFDVSPQKDDRYFEMYSPEINGFVQEVAYEQNPGAINRIEVRLIGAMGLFSATKRIFNSTIYQGSVFDAAEIMDSRLFSLYSNLFAGINPLEILDILLDSTYLIRSGVPQNTDIALTPEQSATIEQQVEKGLANSDLPPDKKEEQKKALIAKKKADELAKQRNIRAANTRRNPDGGISPRLAFFDILSLRAFNQYGLKDAKGREKGPKHMFNMSSFLFANVMRMRKFNVRLPSSDKLNVSVSDSFKTSVGKIINLPRESSGSGGSILEITRSLDKTDKGTNKGSGNKYGLDFVGYFRFLNEGFGNFTPGLKTGFEIMNDVSGSSYLELFETTGGRFIFRTPQYNNNVPIYPSHITSTLNTNRIGETSTADPLTGRVSTEGTTTTGTVSAGISKVTPNMLTSDDIIPIESMYRQDASGLRSKQQLAYGFDLVGGPIIEQLQYFYSNGKLVSQYGLQMGSTEINPNVRAITKERLEQITTGTESRADLEKYLDGTFNYCRFFLEYANMQLFTGTVRAAGSPRVEVGRTYFDIPNQKFGYIQSVSKSLVVGQSYTMTFDLIAVRDAVFGEKVQSEKEPRPKFRPLPYLEDFVSLFKGEKKIIPSEGAGATVPQKAEPLSGDVWRVFISDRNVTSGSVDIPPVTP